MSELFSIYQPDKIREKMSFYETANTRAGESRAMKIARGFKADGKFADLGSRLVMKNRTCVLEVFEASGSVWWTRVSRRKSEPLKPKKKFLPEKEAVARADEYLKEVGLSSRYAHFHSVGYTEVWVQEKDEEPKGAATRQHVNYRFKLGGLPVFGPGAKMQVVFDGGDEVTEAYRFWRTPKKDREDMRPLSLKSVAGKFTRFKEFSCLEKGEAEVVVHDVSLGYYAMPPREVQNFLVPVYRFEGFVSTPHFERHEFSMHVPAMKMDVETLKKKGAVNSAVPEWF